MSLSQQCGTRNTLSFRVCTHTAPTARMIKGEKKAHSKKKKKCAGKVGGGGYIRKVHLHEASLSVLLFGTICR